MHAPRRCAPPWERRIHHPRHPTGRARRRWPRAYDGPVPADQRVKRRYAREYEHDRRRSTLEQLRQSPVRNGLIGLAVAGAAVPIAVNRYQQALRTDPGHERMVTRAGGTAASPESVAGMHGRLETASESADAVRDRVVRTNVRKYSDYGLTRELAQDIYDIAVQSAVDPDIAFGLVRAESSFKNTSTSHVGAVGLTQLMPRTAAWLVPGTTTAELRNPKTNLAIGMKYLNQLTEKYGGDVDLALTAYNRGPGTVDRILDRGGNPDNGYAGFVKTGEIGAHEG